MQAPFCTDAFGAIVWLHTVVDTLVDHKMPHSYSVLQPSVNQPKVSSHNQQCRASSNNQNPSVTNKAIEYHQTPGMLQAQIPVQGMIKHGIAHQEQTTLQSTPTSKCFHHKQHCQSNIKQWHHIRQHVLQGEGSVSGGCQAHH